MHSVTSTEGRVQQSLQGERTLAYWLFYPNSLWPGFPPGTLLCCHFVLQAAVWDNFNARS